MNSYYLNKLEYNKILEILSNFCTTFIGKRLCLELLPSNDKNKVKHYSKDEILELYINTIWRKNDIYKR